MERSDFDDLDRALSTNADLVAECVRQLDAAVGREAVAGVYRSLVQKYGEQAAAVAVEFYRAQRDAAAPEGEYEAQVYAPENRALLEWDVRDAYLRSRDESSVARILAGRAQQRVMAYADETFAANAYRDPARPYFAIVPHPGACGWCVMLGSNGFMYSTAATANAARHAHCKCTPCVEFGSDPHLDGYDPKAMQDSYRSCRETVEDDARRKWAGMSEEERAKHTRAGRNGNRRVSYDAYLRNRIANEMNARDRGWLQTGHAPTPTFESEKLEIAVKKQRPHEFTSAVRLCSHGVRADFKVDEVQYTDRDTGIVLLNGKADLSGGYELKTLSTASTYSTVDGYLHQVSKKKSDAVAVVFDNTDNDSLSDEELAALILRSRRFRRGRVYLLGESGYTQIR